MARKGGSWTKVVLFISLYVSLLESLIEWALILYLYGHRQVDSKMTPSLILALIASFLTVPLVVLHSILAWQYNRVCGFGSQKAILNTACTYLLRLTIIVWLAASVAGLVVVSQKVSCLPDTTDINNNNSFWKVGVSCALHRAVVIVSVLAFVTVCLYFCSRELSPRPYDVSLWGFYICGYHEGRKGSTIRSSSTLSDTRKSDLFFGRVNEEKAWPIQPTPIHPRPHLSRSLDSDPTHDDDILSGSTISPNGTLSRRSPGRTSHEMEIASISLSRPLTDARIYDPYLQWPTQTTPIELPDDRDPPSTHTRQRSKSSSSSSSSSLRRFFPKSFPLSLPLSADPQIRALSNPLRDVGKQALESRNLHPSNTNTNNVEEPDRAEQCRRLPRSITTNSADAPEVIPQPSNTCTAPIQTPIQTPIRTPIQTVSPVVKASTAIEGQSSLIFPRLLSLTLRIRDIPAVAASISRVRRDGAFVVEENKSCILDGCGRSVGSIKMVCSISISINIRARGRDDREAVLTVQGWDIWIAFGNRERRWTKPGGFGVRFLCLRADNIKL
ncbi:hypothetical protein EYZ11_004956 [Aspergillus tanneri]|uniref:Uncharacterized protein n=1 Tax=Aspergillus tanneri TaxID=1220188 RepID=A0A4V3UPK8_9EURO|nr:hypothetical protein EYZ11_004956 [Aspergillus tanneri]